MGFFFAKCTLQVYCPVMQKVLVTGSSGFVGQHLVKKLLELNYDVKELVRDPQKSLDPNTTKIQGDITKFGDVIKAVEECDIVFHLAGHIAYRSEDRPLMELVNVKGTQYIVDACITHNTPKLIHMSSVVTIGASFNKKILDEESTYNMGSYNLGYFETKREAEKRVIEGVLGQGLNASILNPSTIYGASDATKGSRKTQLKVAQGKFPFYSGGGVNVVHVDDVIAGLIAAISKGAPGRRYILAGENITIKELFTKIARAANVKPPNFYLPTFIIKSMGVLNKFTENRGIKLPVNSETATTSTLYHWYTSLRAQKELGISFQNSDIAIRDSVNWMKKNGLLGKN